MEKQRRRTEPSSLADKVADKITDFSGSWKFLGLHVVWWTPWIALRVEPFPYGLLTMLLSLEAIVLATIIMISQNRSAAVQRKMAERDDEEIGEIHGMSRELLDMQKEQMTHDTRSALHYSIVEQFIAEERKRRR